MGEAADPRPRARPPLGRESAAAPATTVGGARSRRGTLAVLCGCSFLVVLNSSTLNVALPTITRELGATNSELQWIVASYSLVFASLLFTCGTVGDRIGRRAVLQGGLAVFGASAVAATLSSDPGGIILARGGMGLGAALVMPSTLSIISDVFPPEERTRAIAIWASVTGVAGTTGPVATGLLLDHYSYRSVFLLNVPTALVVLAGSLVLPASKDPRRTPLDPLGAALSMVALGTFVYALITAPQRGWLSPATLGMFALTAVTLVLFIRWELMRKDPMLDVRLFLHAPFRLGTLGMTVAFFGMFGTGFLLTQYFQLSLGYSPLGTAIRFLPTGITLGVVSTLTPRLGRRFGIRRVAGVGLGLIAVSEAALLFVRSDSGLWLVLISMVVLLAGLALTLSPLTTAVMSSVPSSRPGSGSATNNSAREVGGALGVAVMGSVAASVYLRGLHASPALPPGTDADVGRSLSSALSFAAQLPGRASSELGLDAQEAFASGIRASVLIPLVITAGIAVLVWRQLPDSMEEPATALESLGVTTEVQLGAPVPTASPPDQEH